MQAAVQKSACEKFQLIGLRKTPKCSRCYARPEPTNLRLNAHTNKVASRRALAANERPIPARTARMRFRGSNECGQDGMPVTCDEAS